MSSPITRMQRLTRFLWLTWAALICQGASLGIDILPIRIEAGCFALLFAVLAGAVLTEDVE